MLCAWSPIIPSRRWPAQAFNCGAYFNLRAYTAIRRRVAFLEHDRETTSDINALSAMIRSGEMLDEVASAVEMQ